MPTKKQNPYIGGSLEEFIERRRTQSSTFAALHDEEFNKLALARQVRELREQQNLSQAELAARAGTKQPAIARIESGKVLPRLDLLHKIAAALGMRLEIHFAK
ncbi:MAG TPA: helix-turn-helix transcriptional regulator [Archangium sp.]|uniref:helix-turn-helix transcriptional regulator n=1 Tax=Archangium sp. TaxID=1872627 RepID=UPI002E2EC2BF|nr:helix-turn-helix transcriptional regulator [Archangium sp.]HEX5744590.1 helix-turn-helix transcriptional regulator [Archangium sp.]